jgi:hypothetical protein
LVLELGREPPTPPRRTAEPAALEPELEEDENDEDIDDDDDP